MRAELVQPKLWLCRRQISRKKAMMVVNNWSYLGRGSGGACSTPSPVGITLGRVDSSLSVAGTGHLLVRIASVIVVVVVVVVPSAPSSLGRTETWPSSRRVVNLDTESAVLETQKKKIVMEKKWNEHGRAVPREDSIRPFWVLQVSLWVLIRVSCVLLAYHGTEGDFSCLTRFD